MRVLILGSDSPLGEALAERQEHSGRHELVLMSRAACRWKSERQAKKTVVRAKCDIVVDVRIEAAGDGGDTIQELDLKRCHWVGKACQRTNIAYLYISGSRVFSGQLGRPYTEDDYPDNEEAVGLLLASAEQMVRDTCERHLILRLGPIFSLAGSRLITQLLGPAAQGGSLIMDNYRRGCPVAVEDAARVVSALLDQLSTGLEPWGIYHYCSSESATYYEFAEALLACASQYSDLRAINVQMGEEPDGLVPLSRALNCDKIRNTFAIRRVPWRGAIAEIVKHYYENL